MYRSLLSLAAAIAALSTILVPTAARAADPVTLNSCYQFYDTSNLTGTLSGLDAQFTNESNKDATLVVIRAEVLGQASLIRDVGTFSPGVEIHHRYRAGGQFTIPAMVQGALGKPTVTCAIDSVTFADGTVWHAPPSAASLSNNPSAITLQPSTLVLNGLGAPAERLMLATGGGRLGVNSDCGSIARVDILATTQHDVALRVTPKATGACAITLRDGNGNFATVPVTINR